jgi:hypothetical protein
MIDNKKSSDLIEVYILIEKIELRLYLYSYITKP